VVVGCLAPVTLADRRAERLVERLLGIQQRIDQCARVLLAGRRCDVRLEVLLDDMDGVLRELGRTAPLVERPALRSAIERTCRAHASWSGARLGSAEERSAAATYLECVDDLAKIATAR
jgi:hypothetical protein